MKNAKQIMIKVQAAPNTHPGGVHGALFTLSYQSELTPDVVKREPSHNPTKLITRNKMSRLTFMLLVLIFEFTERMLHYRFNLTLM
jgi:hypothetical protein